MRFFVIRHGETAWNVEGRFQGQEDTELNENGLRQARLLGNRLAGHKFDAVLTSPLARARKTAEIASSECEYGQFITVDALTEINHGSWEGRLADDIEAEWPELMRLWRSEPEKVKMPGARGENLEDILRRAAPAVQAAAEKYEGDLLLASHDAVIKVLLCHWLDAPLSSFFRFQLPNCSITVVEVKKGSAPRMLLMGDAAHLGDPFERPEQKGL
ncbi:MAG: histidine phosphatase family protein [Synergistaceae bacterium]|nr:histidine phosphatase family protein [Synergistaceae bacterium]